MEAGISEENREIKKLELIQNLRPEISRSVLGVIYSFMINSLKMIVNSNQNIM